MQLINLAQIQTTFGKQVPGAYCTMTCTRGGPALVDAPRTRLAVAVTGDPRHPFVPGVNVDWARDASEQRFRALGDSGARSAFAGTDFRQLRSNAVLRWEYA